MLNIKQKNCIIDCRVSSTKQQSGGGLDDQKTICLGYTKNKGWKVSKIFSKVYSGRAEEREDFEEIILFIKKLQKTENQIDYYVVKSIDRFTRDGAITFNEMSDRLKYLGVQLVDVYGVIQPNQNTLEHLNIEFDWSLRSPTSTAQLLEAQRAKDEVTDILTRMIGAEVRLVREGYKVRSANDGFINKRILVDGKNKTIEIPDPERAHFFIKMYELRAQLVDDKEIVKRINAMGFRTKTFKKWSEDKKKIIATSGNKLLNVKTLQKYIKRTIYAGVRCEKWTNNEPIRAQYDGLVSIKLFNEANRGDIFIEEREDGSLKIHHNYSPLSKKRNKDNPEYPFKNVVLCPFCKSSFLGSASTGETHSKHPAYHCGGTSSGIRSHKYFRIPKKEFEDNVKKFLTSLRFDKDFINSFEGVLNDVYIKREKEVVSQSSVISLSVGNLKAQQASVIEALTVTNSSIARKKLEEKIEELEILIKEAENERQEIEITEKDIKTFIRYAREIMERPYEILIDNDNLSIKRTLFGLVFEEIPTYQEILNGTPKLSYIFRLSKDFETDKSQLVTLPGIEPELPA